MLLLSQGMVIITKFCFVFHLSPLGMYPFGFNWMWRLCLAFSDFFFPLRVNSNITWFYCAGDKKHCSCIVHRSHNTIHIFKNYFATVFSVFSFSKNKFNPNGPYVSYFLFHIVKYTCVNEILNWIIIKKKVNCKYC